MNLYPKLKTYINSLLPEIEHISDERKALLDNLATYVKDQKAKGQPVNLNFICTHNSRRSHISQIWAATAAAFYGLEDVACFSGGTEATAFNPRAVAGLERAGFQIHNSGGENPHYIVQFSPDGPHQTCFSKVYDHPANPKANFAAVMTCSHADANCPFIPGATRISLTYEDPKVADDTPQESAKYDERIRQIGTELLYAFSLVI